MRLRISMAALVAVLAVPTGTALAKLTVNAERHPAPERTPAQKSYLDAYEEVAEKIGEEAPGRNIVDDGYRERPGAVRPATKAEVQESTARLERMLSPSDTAQAPVEAADYGSTVAAPVTPPAPVATGGGSGCVGMEAESGSAGYSAMSPTGYIGCYQIAPEHYDGGMCSGLGTDPGGQDACAAKICAEQGSGAWTNPSGQNPCGRLGG